MVLVFNVLLVAKDIVLLPILTLIMTIVILFILYFLTSSLHWWKYNTDKPFTFLRAEQFIFYIFKYLFLIFIYAIVVFILNEVVASYPENLLYKNRLMWGLIILICISIYITYIVIEEGWRKFFTHYLVCFFYTWLNLVIVRSTLLWILPPEYAKYIAVSLLGVLFPDLSAFISKVVSQIFIYLQIRLPDYCVAYAQDSDSPNTRKCLSKWTSFDRDNFNFMSQKLWNFTRIPKHLVPRLEALFITNNCNGVCVVEALNPRGTVWSTYMVPIHQVRFLSFGEEFYGKVSVFALDQPGFDHLKGISVRFENSLKFQTFRHLGDTLVPVYFTHSDIIVYLDNMTRVPYDPSNFYHQDKRLQIRTGPTSVYTIGQSRTIPELGQSKVIDMLYFDQQNFNKCVVHKKNPTPK